MIRIRRGPEPLALASVRADALMRLRSLGREPISDDIDGYRVVAEDLWRAQKHKCCYCEGKLPRSHNDVEHYRPKARADRLPGCVDIHGYWWLAFEWSNLLFACPGCNRSSKNDRFPLRLGCSPLRAEDVAPGTELPLFLDPAGRSNPVEHIEFVASRVGGRKGGERWWARPRNGSELGLWTIEVCSLNRQDLVELRSDYVKSYLSRRVRQLRRSLRSGVLADVMGQFDEAMLLLHKRCAYVAFSYDVFRHKVPNSMLAQWGLAWPAPSRVG